MSIIKKEELNDLLKTLKGKKIVFTNGCFDILHIGHAKYLKESKKFGDILIVGLNSDSSVKRLKGENRPINNEADRAGLLDELKSVDYVVIFEENSPVELLNIIKPDIYTKGADYTLETLPEAPVIKAYGGKVEFITFVEGKSTTNVVKNILKK
ncbi:MAG: D-glycero-beta-D-manno-heptose 1-phosphate adenylyltransferase [Candidatus Gastranaerophilales bacterium]|nr:D-glycero-beta-D-manno-heptose 1-phosphate adenylyltransferase [Candidatus Gastranaerophilales bacterium]